MPIPSPEPYRRSNLTKQQKQEELHALYGVPMSNGISAADIERMREILADHDATSKEDKDFDPSKVVMPYRFQKFPMMIYHHENSYPAHDEVRDILRGSMVVTETIHVTAHVTRKIVKSQSELDHALANGWSETPPEFREESEPELAGALAGEAARVDERISKLQSKRRA